ncbi:hypothetical protein Angca_002252, partial [Angiostrongylus cantonensis]
TVQELAEQLGLGTGTISTHLNRTGKVKKSSTSGCHTNYTVVKKVAVLKYRLPYWKCLILGNKKDPFLNRTVTCDEKWISCDNRRRS